jgi:hypothetical protein
MAWKFRNADPSAGTFPLSINLGAPNRPGIFSYMIRDLDLIVFAQFLPLRAIGADFDPTSNVAHPDFYDPLFVIRRPLILDFFALFHRRDVILPDHDRVATFLFATDQPNQQQRKDAAERERSLHKPVFVYENVLTL